MKKILLFGVFLAWQAMGHPVIYKGGVVAQTVLRPSMALSEVNYSLSRRFAVGLSHHRLVLSSRTIEAGFANLNFLVHRWNRSHSQANLYLSAGGGIAQDSVSGTTSFLTGAAMADYETRWLYTAAMVRGYRTDSQAPWMAQYRIGAAPYAGTFDELNSWIVLQFDYFPSVYTQMQITPLMRFFYKTALWEFGASLTGRWWLQLMVHF